MGAVKNAGVALLVGVLASGALTGGSLGTAAVATTEREPTPVVTQEPAPTPEPTSTPATTSTPAPTAEPTPAPFDDDAEPEAGPPLESTAASSADRLSGADRYATAVAVSKETFEPGVPIVFLASGVDYPDALSAAPLAAALGGEVEERLWRACCAERGVDAGALAGGRRVPRLLLV